MINEIIMGVFAMSMVIAVILTICLCYITSIDLEIKMLKSEVEYLRIRQEDIRKTQIERM